MTLAGSLMIGSCVEDMLMSWRRVRTELSVVWQLSTLAPCLLSVCDRQTNMFGVLELRDHIVFLPLVLFFEVNI